MILLVLESEEWWGSPPLMASLSPTQDASTIQSAWQQKSWKTWHHGCFLSILRPFVPLRLQRVIVGGELVAEFVHVVIAHVHHVVGDLLWICCVFVHAKSHQSLIWSSYQMKWLYPSPTVDVNAKGLDARDENVNTKIKFAAVDQVRQIHVPGWNRLYLERWDLLVQSGGWIQPLRHQFFFVSARDIMGWVDQKDTLSLAASWNYS